MDSTEKRKITRNRESLACKDCRRRKLKCDRCSPCGSCIKRGDQASCTYQRFTRGFEYEHERRLEAESRLEHLERLVQQLSQQTDGSLSQRQSTVSEEASQEASASESRPETGAFPLDGFLHNGSTHWSAMLEDIEELRYTIIRNEINPRDEGIPEDRPDVATKFILGPAAPLPLQQILLQYLPPKQESDNLVAAYFRSGGVAAPYIHASSFQRQYQQFWETPYETSALWISILFSIIHVARNALVFAKSDLPPDQRYIVASASCLALGEYFRPQRFAVESLLLFAQSQSVTGSSISRDVGVIFGLIIRLATSMGLHRDPEPLKISVFEKEMRRRVWSLCMQLDLLVSFQLGLPSNIQYPTWDTLPPRNLRDSDFDEKAKELPPARPDSEPTNIMFYIAKHRLMTIFEKVLRHSLTTGIDTTSDVDRLDTEIRQVYLDLPKILRPRLIAESIVDSPTMIVTRLCVFNLYQKCLCVLHRPYVTQERLNSIQTCYDAAFNIVRYFSDSYDHFLPGGQMETERWFLGSFTWHDFLLGVTALCLTFCVGSQRIPRPQMSCEETLGLLRQAQSIFCKQSERNEDNKRIKKLLDAMLYRFERHENGINGHPIRDLGSAVSFLEYPSTSPSLLDHASSQDCEQLSNPQNPASEILIPDLAQSETTPNSAMDFSWDYLEQFLNLSGDDLLTIG